MLDQDNNSAAAKLEPLALCESTDKDQETVEIRSITREKIPTAKGKEYSLGLLKRMLISCLRSHERIDESSRGIRISSGIQR